MLVNEGILKELKTYVTEQTLEKAEELHKNEKVLIKKINYENNNNYTINAEVEGRLDKYQTKIEVKNSELNNVNCTCPDYESTYGTCKHILATAYEVNSSEKYKRIFNINNNEKIVQPNADSEKYRIYRQMISSFYEEEQNEEQIKMNTTGDILLSPRLIYNYNSKELKVDFKIGNEDKKMYKLKNLVEFYDKMQENQTFKYGLKLEFIHTKEAFSKDSQKILDFILKYAEIIKYANESTSTFYTSLLNTSYIVLSNTGLDDFFEAMKDSSCIFENEYGENELKFIDNEPDIKFEIKEKGNSEFIITTDTDVFDYTVIPGKKYIYFFQHNKIYRCSKKFEKTVLKLINIFRVNLTKEIVFKKDEFADFHSVIFPTMKERFLLDKVDKEEIEKYMPERLIVKVFLDINKSNYITVDLKFQYKDIEFNPFENVKNDIPRNAIEESKALDMFKNAGFMLDASNNKLILADEEKIYNFLKYNIENFISKFEVLATEQFKNRKIREPKVKTIGVKIENDLLNIDISELNFSNEELENILKSYKLRKKFYRLKNGEFIDLEGNKTLDTLEKIVESADVSYKELATGTIRIPIYRSLYLDKILKQNEIVIKQTNEYKNLIDDVYNRQIIDKYEIPKNLNANLREYQKIGYNWLKTLDEYKLGGILADDMGLGKTIQLLSVIMDYVERTEKRNPSLVICPSSLALNWQEEAKKFTPTLKTIVISGKLEDRQKQIKHIKDYDLAITSYDLLKRDIEFYKENNHIFKYIIADEAQYIKNSNTKNARTIKEIKGQTRYALTGTPIENSLSELWSIFDFIMPGYLFSYTKFRTHYEAPIIKDNNEDILGRLKTIIEPFILRRAKEKVLTELPDKTITILNNEMEGEQQKLYLSYMQNAKQEAKNEIEVNGIQNSQMKILSLLMRLRQICCHPSLFIENYNGESKKLNQCIEIIRDAVSGGHKILLFSVYTSMFPFIESELKEQGIKYFKLTGQTKVSDRMDLVNEFNDNDDVKVFLISLKAGGTGLNLIGADMVIHYDPWWNLSAENQATDRTYRIGQKRNVQVYKLITKNSIEEKIYNLQEKKAKLADSMLSTKETFISKLSKEEIMDLFE